MRLLPALVILLVAFPGAASLATLPPADPAAAFDPTDAELMLLLARLNHPELQPLAAPPVAAGDSLPAIVLRLAERGGRVDLAPEDLAPFADLDARVAGPTLVLLAAVEAFWDARDHAMRDLTPEQVARMHELAAAHEQDSLEFQMLADGVYKEEILAAAIMLVDVIESTANPALQAAAASGAWPASATADPVGVLRLGGTGNDAPDALDRIVQIDPRGDDRYTNNAGGTTMLDPIEEPSFNILTPIAVQLDFAGNDDYNTTRFDSAFGADPLGTGFGYLRDEAGNDSYWARHHAIAANFGLVHDLSGNDRYRALEGLGYRQFSFLRDDGGNDWYFPYDFGGGATVAGPEQVAVLWDRAGVDRYVADGFAYLKFGWSSEGGRGWLVDEGDGADIYETQWVQSQYAHGCNDCTWRTGTGPANGALGGLYNTGGQGNDNRGGLASLIAHQDPMVQTLPHRVP